MIAPMLDTRFLSVHPVTAKWWQQREKCSQCKHYTRDGYKNRKNEFAERCGASRLPTPGQGNRSTEYCIDARAPAEERQDGRPGLCGPDAVLFEPKEGGAA